jgi:SAM-dependent methyltransferase
MADLTPIQPSLFAARATARFAARSAVRAVAHKQYRRTTEAVQAEYDPQREAFRRRFLESEWSADEYVMTDVGATDTYFFANILDGRLVVGGSDEVRHRLLTRLADEIQRVSARSVIEVGSGTGRNLLFLKSRMPWLKATGLELSRPSVEVAIEASRRYGIEAAFHQHDVTKPWPVEDPADVVFSVHALEQMPRQAAKAAQLMQEHARKAVLLFEPLPDLWSGPIGLASRLRARYLDRLRAHAFDALSVERRELLPDGMALNRTTEIFLLPLARPA